MRISDWSSDVCSSDLAGQLVGGQRAVAVAVHSVEGVAHPVLVFDQRDAAVAIAVHAREVIAGAVDLRVRGERQERRQDKGRQEFHRRIVVVPLALAPPPAKAGGGWEGVPTVRADPKGTPPRPVRPSGAAAGRSSGCGPMARKQPSSPPAFAGEGARARGFRRSYKNRWRAIGPPSRITQ